MTIARGHLACRLFSHWVNPNKYTEWEDIFNTLSDQDFLGPFLGALTEKLALRHPDILFAIPPLGLKKRMTPLYLPGDDSIVDDDQQPKNDVYFGPLNITKDFEVITSSLQAHDTIHDFVMKPFMERWKRTLNELLQEVEGSFKTSSREVWVASNPLAALHEFV